MRAALAGVALSLGLALVPAAAGQTGRELFQQGCSSCHGLDARGVEARGPNLHGVGAAAADFYLRTGRMPIVSPREQPVRTKPLYSSEEIDRLVAYIASLGGPPVPQPHPERGSLAQGYLLFRENCAGCHQIVAAGGTVIGAVAPALDPATPTQIAEAVRVGPYVMPRFPESKISRHELDSLIAYVQQTKHPVDRGGWGLRHLGPIPEGLVAWLLAGTALVLVARAIGERRQS